MGRPRKETIVERERERGEGMVEREREKRVGGDRRVERGTDVSREVEETDISRESVETDVLREREETDVLREREERTMHDIFVFSPKTFPPTKDHGRRSWTFDHTVPLSCGSVRERIHSPTVTLFFDILMN